MTRKWFYISIFTSNHFRVRRIKREIEREKEERGRRESPDHSSDRAPIRRPQTELQSDDPSADPHRATPTPTHTSVNQVKIDSNVNRLQSPTTYTSADRRSHRANQTKIDSNATRSRICRVISPSPSPCDLASRSNPVASLFLLLSI